MTPTYRERLRAEGLSLAGSGALGTVLLLALSPQARRWPLNTAGQLAVVAALLLYFSPRGARKGIGEAREIEHPGETTGEATPLWQMPSIVASLTLSVSLPAGWDAGVRVTGGTMLVGLAQAVLMERMVRAEEEASARTFYRMPGSRILRGTPLGYVRARRD